MDKKAELGYIDQLVTKKFDRLAIDWTFLADASKEKLDSMVGPIEQHLKNNTDFENYSTEQKDKFFNDVMEMHENFKTFVKRDALCKLSLQGTEIKFIEERLLDHVEYDASSVFVGIHLKGTWLNNLKYSQTALNSIEIGMSNAIVLYDLLSTTKITGLKQKAYIFAKVLRSLAECSKIYQHYDNESNRLFKLISEWNMGLSNDDKELVKSAMLAEAISENVSADIKK